MQLLRLIVAGVKGMSCTALRQTTARERFSWPIENGKLQKKSNLGEIGQKMIQEVTFSRFMGIYGQIFYSGQFGTLYNYLRHLVVT